MKICLIRLDKIGDLVSTLPVDQISELQRHEVRWVINEGLAFLAECAEPQREFIEVPLNNRKVAEKKLHQFLGQYQPDLVVVFYAPWWVSKVLWQARVRHRFGRKSQWHSFVFLNEGLRQNRSQPTKHEADYNLELLLAAIDHAEKRPMKESSPEGQNRSAPLLNLSAPPFRHLFEKFELRPGDYYVVHPGMAGSALNWPLKHYVSLIEKLKLEKEVIITGTKADEKWLGPLKRQFGQDPRVQILQDQLSLPELLFILKNSAGVVAPSTGVLHLAASLNVSTVGIYSPVAAQHPKRWAPRGRRAHFLVPTVSDPEKINESCMEQISPDQVIACLKKN